jgi:hypothetical protein
MTTFLDEAQVELLVLDILGEMGWARAFGRASFSTATGRSGGHLLSAGAENQPS